MPYRKEKFVNGYYYHIFNKTIDRLPAFINRSFYKLFLNLIKYYRSENAKIRYSFFINLEKEEKILIEEKINDKKSFLVDIGCFCLLENHYHFLLKQNKDDGIIKFISNLTNAFTKYYNIINKRIGPLFLPRFHSVLIKNREQFIHLSRYIHLNPYSHGFIKNINQLKYYPYSSFMLFFKKDFNSLINKKIILSEFNNSQKRYQEFVLNHAEYQKSLQKIKKLALEK